MPATVKPALKPADGILAPLALPLFRRLWLANLVGSTGWLIQGVGAAWAMTQMTAEADKVALVQTARELILLPLATDGGAPCARLLWRR